MPLPEKAAIASRACRRPVAAGGTFPGASTWAMTGAIWRSALHSSTNQDARPSHHGSEESV